MQVPAEACRIERKNEREEGGGLIYVVSFDTYEKGFMFCI